MLENKIFGLGLSRTGTNSLTNALSELGIKCHHYPYDQRTQAELWDGKPLSCLQKFDGITDISIVPFFKTLDRLYPGSRFILTLRDTDSWLASMRKHFDRIWDEDLMESPRFMAFTEAISRKVYGTVTFDAEKMLAAYREHAAEVQDYFSKRPQDVLVMNIIAGDGWEKLCPFLGIPIRETPFPHANAFRNESFAWGDKVKRFLRILQDLGIRPEKTVLLDDGKLRAYVEPVSKPIPFPARNGKYAGRLEGDVQVCEAFSEVLEEGMHTLVVAWPAFWWLDSYTDFAQMVRGQFSVVLKNDVAEVYDLTLRKP